MHRHRIPCNSFFVVNMASGMDHEWVLSMMTTTSCTMVAILQLMLSHAVLNCTFLWYWTNMLWSIDKYWLTSITWPYRRAVTNFSSRRGIIKSSRGTKKVWWNSRRLLLKGGWGGRGMVEVNGLGKCKIFSLNVFNAIFTWCKLNTTDYSQWPLPRLWQVFKSHFHWCLYADKKIQCDQQTILNLGWHKF